MKWLFSIFCFFSCSSLSVSGQETELLDLGHPEISAEFPGGEKALRQCITDNLIYPEKEKENKMESTVLVKFEVDEQGEIGNIMVVRPLSSDNFTKEAKRLVESMPQWIPGSMNGKNISMDFFLPIKFQIPDNQ